MRFPESSRVAILQGVIEESKGHLNDAQILYDRMLKKEPSNVLLHKRRIACIKTQPEGISRATEALAEFVDIFPADQESWLELAELYLEQNKYDQAAYALEELLLLAPHNVFYVLKYAEVSYTMRDFAKAYKMYLRILELGDGNLAPSSPRVIDRVQGPWVRALWGLKMVSALLPLRKLTVQCTSKMLDSKALTMSNDIVAERVSDVDTLVTKLLFESVYAPDAKYATPDCVRAAIRAVLTPTS